MMDIREFAGYWPILVRKWHTGEAIHAHEIDKAFDWDDEDIPPYVKPLLRALIKGEVNIKRGVKSEWPDSGWRSLVRHVESLRQQIEYYRKNGEHEHDLSEYPYLAEHIEDVAAKHGSPLVLATDAIADQFQGVTYDALEQQRKRMMAARKKSKPVTDKN